MSHHTSQLVEPRRIVVHAVVHVVVAVVVVVVVVVIVAVGQLQYSAASATETLQYAVHATRGAKTVNLKVVGVRRQKCIYYFLSHFEFFF